MERTVRRRRAIALVISLSAALAGMVGTSQPAQSGLLCGHAKAGQTSVPIGTYCVNENDPRCDGFPAAGVIAGPASVFVCLDL